jgi:hypothetical protein
VSFGVSVAFVRTAGAASVTCPALGEFGHCLNYFEIDVENDPFAPVVSGDYNVRVARSLAGTRNPKAQDALIHLVR